MKLSQISLDVISNIRLLMTEEEKKVYELSLSGKSREQIANIMHCDVRTIDRRIFSIKDKAKKGEQIMQNNINALNNILFEQIERINDHEIDGPDLEFDLKKAKAIEGLGGKIIACGAMAIRAKQTIEESNVDGKIDIAFLGVK